MSHSNEKKNSFYSSFFNRNTFLSAGAKSISRDILWAQGFDENSDFQDKVVLELGAGGGRMTLALAELGLIQKASKYIIVEPSEGIEHIQKILIPFGLSNVEFVQATLENLSNHISSESIDYFILVGVLPHIELPCDEISKRIAFFVVPNGILHLMYSFHGFSKNITKVIQPFVANLPYIFRILFAYIHAIVQFLVFKSKLGRVPYIHNFFLLKREGLKETADQFLEIFSVYPYNVYIGYSEILNCFSAYFRLEKLFNYSLALTLRKTESMSSDEQKYDSLPNAINKNLVVCYKNRQDWFFNAVVDELRKYGYEFSISDFDEIVNIQDESLLLIAGWNYFETPYHLELKKYPDKHIYLWQMLIR
jgi:ubiquinone/menaquinone biosynthesis C-methylase UbiE